MTLFNLHFIYPEFLLLFLVWLPLLYGLWKTTQAQKTWHDYCDTHLLPHIVQEKSQRQSPWWMLWLGLLLISATVALSGPSWQRISTPVYKKTFARVIVLDLSNSMLASDIPPTRLQRTKYKILDLLHDIHEGQTGMVVFSSEPFVVSPLTDDSNTIAAMVPTLNTDTVPVQGSNITTALQKAGQLLKRGGAEHGQIILLTDSTPSKSAIEASRQLAQHGYTTSVIGVGTERGGPIVDGKGGFVTDSKGAIQFAKLDVSALMRLASAGDGAYIPFTDNDADISQVLKNNAIDKIDQQMHRTEHEKVLWQNQGHWFVWAAILFLVLLSRRGWLEKVLP